MTRYAYACEGDQARELIAIRAYELWENGGRPHGCDVIHWRQAEQEILSCLGVPHATPLIGTQPPPVRRMA